MFDRIEQFAYISRPIVRMQCGERLIGKRSQRFLVNRAQLFDGTLHQLRDILAAMSPLTIGVAKEVPLHFTMPADVSRTVPATVMYLSRA